MMEEAKNPRLDGSEGSAYDVYIPMGMTAENVAERCSVTREQQDGPEWCPGHVRPPRPAASCVRLNRRRAR